MNIFLSLLPENQAIYEGQGYIKRVGDLLEHSNRHCHVNDPAEADIILFLESNRFKSQHDFASFSQSELLIKYAHKSYTLNYSDAPIAFLPGLYVCNPRQTFDPLWTRAIPYPWPSPNPLIQSIKLNSDFPAHTVSFRGSLSHPVRDKLLTVMSVNPELGPCQQVHSWFNHTVNEQTDYIFEIVNSCFVLCPRGIGTSTYRLYEALRLGRVPIIISDEWVPPESVNWISCSLRISEQCLDDVPLLLDKYQKYWPEMSHAASSVWNTFFSDSVLADYLFDQLESLTFNRHPCSDWNQLKRRWKSSSFRRQNQWDFMSRAKRCYVRNRNKFF